MQKVRAKESNISEKSISSVSAKFEEMKSIFNFKMQEFEYNEKLNLQILSNFQSKLSQLESTNFKLKEEIEDCRSSSIEALSREAEYTKIIDELKELVSNKESYIEQLEQKIKSIEKPTNQSREPTKEDQNLSDAEKDQAVINNNHKISNNIRIADNDANDYKDKYLKLKNKVQEYKQHKKTKADFIDNLQDKLSNLENQYSKIIDGMNEQLSNLTYKLKQEAARVS